MTTPTKLHSPFYLLGRAVSVGFAFAAALGIAFHEFMPAISLALTSIALSLAFRKL